jgi:hypothetical protein
MPRSQTHVRETASRNAVRSLIDDFYPNGDALIREWSERDYGIDFVLELFDKGQPTGKIAFLQIKGTGKKIEKLKTSDEVSCPNVSQSSFEYARQNRIPYILIYVSTEKPITFYYLDLQSLMKKDSPMKDLKTGETTTVRIPIANVAIQDLTGFFKLVNSYY